MKTLIRFTALLLSMTILPVSSYAKEGGSGAGNGTGCRLQREKRPSAEEKKQRRIVSKAWFESRLGSASCEGSELPALFKNRMIFKNGLGRVTTPASACASNPERYRSLMVAVQTMADSPYGKSLAAILDASFPSDPIFIQLRNSSHGEDAEYRNSSDTIRWAVELEEIFSDKQKENDNTTIETYLAMTLSHEMGHWILNRVMGGLTVKTGSDRSDDEDDGASFQGNTKSVFVETFSRSIEMPFYTRKENHGCFRFWNDLVVPRKVGEELQFIAPEYLNFRSLRDAEEALKPDLYNDYQDLFKSEMWVTSALFSWMSGDYSSSPRTSDLAALKILQAAIQKKDTLRSVWKSAPSQLWFTLLRAVDEASETDEAQSFVLSAFLYDLKRDRSISEELESLHGGEMRKTNSLHPASEFQVTRPFRASEAN